MEYYGFTLALTAVVTGLVNSPGLAGEDLVPLAMDWNEPGSPVVDHRGYLEAPAGQKGFIRMDGERLVKPDGSRFRIWGINVTGGGCFPSREMASRMADDLARMGINCVRFHGLDSSWGGSSIDYSRDDTLHFNPSDLDKFDYFVAELKQRGIYTNLNLNVFRRYKKGDDVRDPAGLGLGKSATYFNQRLLELQEDYARKLLTHRNPYTGNEYRYEPAVFCVEMVNENSVIEGWLSGRLEGKDVEWADTWAPIPVSYAEELTEQFNHWLKDNVDAIQVGRFRREARLKDGQRLPRLKPDQFQEASAERFRAEADFYLDLEIRFFRRMRQLLRDELGVKSLLVGSADHNDWICGYPHIIANRELDIIDGHGYWEHPRIGEETWIKNTPMVNDPWDSTVTQFARTPMVGRPYTISETNHPFPHEYACEGIPILTAYALLHDWDGIYWFTYDRGPNAKASDGIHKNGWFDLSVDPVKMTAIAACAALWYRRDVAASENRVVRSLTLDQIMERLRADRARLRPFYTPGFARSTPLRHATRWQLADDGPPDFPEDCPRDRIESDTGQLRWLNADRKQGIVTVDTPATSALIGFVRDNDQTTSHLAAQVENRFCALLLSTLDEQPIAHSQRMILAATAKCTNSGVQWNEDRQTLAAWGTGPTVIEVVRGTVTLRGLIDARQLTVQPLSATGKPAGPPAAARQSGGDWTLTLGASTATWYLIEVRR